jgi:transglutaminase-like putative cysteine protease
MDAQPRLLQPTALLDFTHPAIEAVVEERGWRQLPTFERIGAVYDFVRNEIAFGYNAGDELPASAVMADGIGQCNTKATLLIALMRAVGIACRFHGFTIDKPLQKGAITGLAYVLAPRRIIHSWVEVAFEGRWVNLEGFILDAPYLASLQRRFPGRQRFCGYGAARTRTSRRTGSPTTSACSTARMSSMRAMARTSPGSSAGSTRGSSATA